MKFSSSIFLFFNLVVFLQSVSAQTSSTVSDEFVEVINLNFPHHLADIKPQTRYTYFDVDYDYVTIDTIVALEGDTLNFALSVIEKYQWSNDTLHIITEYIELQRDNRILQSSFTFDRNERLKSFNNGHRDLNVYWIDADSIVIEDTLKYTKGIQKVRSKNVKYGEDRYPSIVEFESAGIRYFDLLSSSGDTLIYNRMYKSTRTGEYISPSESRSELKIIIKGDKGAYAYYDGFAEDGSILFNNAFFLNENRQLTKSKSYSKGKVVGVNRMAYNTFGDQSSRAYTNNVKSESIVYQNSLSNTVYIYDGEQVGSFLIGEAIYNKLIIVHSN